MGENGAGKTTLVRLLLGLYRPTEGRIMVDGVDVADLDPDEWRQRATAIFQDFVRYPTTPFENIAYADPSLLGDEATSQVAVHPRVVSAAAQAGADAFIDALPFKYATPLGKEWEGGVELSIGQWQRLAIGRAYLRDAQIIALDEPTAALDPRAEAEVYNHFKPRGGRQDRHPRIPPLGFGQNGGQDRRPSRRSDSRGRRSRLTPPRRWRIRPHVPATGELVPRRRRKLITTR